MYKLLTKTTDDLNLISLSEARTFLYTEVGDYPDADLTKMIGAARSHVEQILQRAVLSSGWIYYRDSFIVEFFNQPQEFVQRDRTQTFEIPRPNLISLDSFKYWDSASSEQTLVEDTDYMLHPTGDFGKAQVEPIGSWPGTQYRKNAVKIEYTAGWNVADVPEEVRQAILIALGDMYENRQTNVTGVSVTAVNTMNSLLSAWKVDNQ